jgi:tRNA A58 N-methylase Trm61
VSTLPAAPKTTYDINTVRAIMVVARESAERDVERAKQALRDQLDMAGQTDFIPAARVLEQAIAKHQTLMAQCELIDRIG